MAYPQRRDIAILVLFALILTVPSVSAKETLKTHIEQAEQSRLAAAHAAASHAAAARQQALAAARARDRATTLVRREINVNAALRQDENQTAAISSRLASLQVAAIRAQEKRNQDVAALKPLLPLIVRISLHPSALLLTAAATPSQAMEGALLMRGLTKRIAQRADSLARVQAKLSALRTAMMAQRVVMFDAVAKQRALRGHLDIAIANDRKLAAAAQKSRAVDLHEAEQAGRQAGTLAGIIVRLKAQQRQRTVANHTVAANIRIPRLLRGAPVAGRLVRGFGENTIAGPATGDTFATAPAAVVSAPCSGRIAFAQRFQSYGNLMILTCDSGDDFVLAGVERFDAAVGTPVVGGQPVARMAGFNPKDPAAQPRLYVQLRRDGRPIDPSTVFASKSAAR